MAKRTERLAGLDGLRAIAVLLVMFYHVCSQGALRTLPGLTLALREGAFGVQIFFVLSGFLITWLLLNEELAHGHISIPMFYFRRAFRILPPAFFYLVFVIVLVLIGVLQVGAKDLLYSALFIRNFYGVGGAVEVGHFWSLAIEEQFYLTWPVALILVTGRKRLLAVFGLLLFLSIAQCVRSTHFGATVTGTYSLLFGCALALARQDPAIARILSWRVLQRELVLFACAAPFVWLVWTQTTIASAPAWFGILAPLAIALTINYAIGNHSDLATRFLSLQPVEWIGRLSYSLYLWQQLFCFSRFSNKYAEQYWPLLFACSFLCAHISYHVIERPALSMRDRLAQRRVSSVLSVPLLKTR